LKGRINKNIAKIKQPAANNCTLRFVWTFKIQTTPTVIIINQRNFFIVERVSFETIVIDNFLGRHQDKRLSQISDSINY
jgi:hypothetical protein